ncbi:hypothetical protein [Marinobacterium zhoushanense]|nr:hypothetical protein [Marinobacterium zhoushanense]
MDNVIPFPIKDKHGLRYVLDLIRNSYLKTGMDPQLADEAVAELEPLLEPLIGGYESVLELPDDLRLSEEQLETVVQAHGKAVQGIFDHYAPRMNLAIATIASLMRKRYTD